MAKLTSAELEEFVALQGGAEAIKQVLYEKKMQEGIAAFFKGNKTLRDLLQRAKEEGWQDQLLEKNALQLLAFDPMSARADRGAAKPAPKRTRTVLTEEEKAELPERILAAVKAAKSDEAHLQTRIVAVVEPQGNWNETHVKKAIEALEGDKKLTRSKPQKDKPANRGNPLSIFLAGAKPPTRRKRR